MKERKSFPCMPGVCTCRVVVRNLNRWKNMFNRRKGASNSS